MIGRARAWVLLACAVVVLLVAWYAGSRMPERAAVPAAGSVRLGPEPGEDVPGYLARLPAELPAAGTEALALVQFDAALPGPAALAAVGTAVPVTAVLWVGVPRVQTALRFLPLQPGDPMVALDVARRQARQQAAADAARSSGRTADVAGVEERMLADPAVPCVLALLVRGDRATLTAVGPGVRAVHAAPTGVSARELALAPLLPGQTERADPLPDDGAVGPSS